jgi:hypothetical protein
VQEEGVPARFDHVAQGVVQNQARLLAGDLPAGARVAGKHPLAAFATGTLHFAKGDAQPASGQGPSASDVLAVIEIAEPTMERLHRLRDPARGSAICPRR